MTIFGTFNLAKKSPNKSLSFSLYPSKTSSTLASDLTPSFLAPSIAFVKLAFY